MPRALVAHILDLGHRTVGVGGEDLDGLQREPHQVHDEDRDPLARAGLGAQIEGVEAPVSLAPRVRWGGPLKLRMQAPVIGRAFDRLQPCGELAGEVVIRAGCTSRLVLASAPAFGSLFHHSCSFVEISWYYTSRWGFCSPLI